MQLDKLTIALTLDNNRIKAVCPELSLEAHGDWRVQALERLQEAIDDAVVVSMDAGNDASDFVRRMYGDDGDDWEGFDAWLEQERYSRFTRKLESAFCDAYPAVDRSDDFIRMKIPYIDWENSPQWDDAERKAYNGLISEGAKSRDWIRFVQAVCAAKYQGWWSAQKPEIYKKWKSIGLPVLSQKKMESMTWEEIEALAFGEEVIA